MKYWIGWPLIPPLALTQSKYGFAMFEPSVKSVPGCLVLIVPSLIGVPVAFSPGLGPHDDVLTAVPLEPELVTAEVEVAILLELLLPQPARRSPPPVRRSAGVVKRARACSPSSPRVDSPGAVTADAD